MHAAVIPSASGVVPERTLKATGLLVAVGQGGGTAWIAHVAQRGALQPAIFTDQPVAVPRRAAGIGGTPVWLPIDLDQGAKDIRHRLVERTRLPLVDQVGGVLRNRVLEFVRCHVDNRQRVGLGAVAVTKKELLVGRTPEGIYEVVKDMQVGDGVTAAVVIAIATEHLAVEGQRAFEVHRQRESGGI